MISETIAQLTGLLKFNVDSSGFRQFENHFKTIQRQMQALQKQAEQLQAKLNIKPKSIQVEAQAKAQKSVTASLDRELKLEKLVERAKRETFATELSQQRLQFAGTKEQAFLNTAAIKDRQQMAVLAAKEHRAHQESLKAQGIAIKNNATLEDAKARQLKAEKLLVQTQVKTQGLQAKHLQTLTATQKIELAMQHARERSQRTVEKFQQTQAATRIREQRQDIKHQQQQQRFEWATARQQHWEANRNAAPAGGGFNPLAMLGGLSGGMAGLAGLGGIGAALYGVTQALIALNARLDKRRDDASEGQQWTTTIEQAGGKNPENQRRAKQRFLEIADKYGTSVDLEAAQTFRSFMMNQQSLGLNIDQAANKYEIQSAAFRGAGMTKEQQKRAAYQLGQIQSKGKPEGADVNDLFDAAGVIAPAIRQAAAERLKFKGTVEQQAAWFKAQITKGNILARDFDTGMANFVKDNADVIAKQNTSINANQTRAENDVYMQQQNINSNVELISAVNDRIKAERELTEATKPVNEAFAKLDTVLMQVESGYLRFLTGRKDDGSKKTTSENIVDWTSSLIPFAGVARGINALGQKAGVATGLISEEEGKKDATHSLANWVGDLFTHKPSREYQLPTEGLGLKRYTDLDASLLSGLKDSALARGMADYSGTHALGTPPPAPESKVSNNSSVTNNVEAPINLEATFNFNLQGVDNPNELVRQAQPALEQMMRDVSRRQIAHEFEGWLLKEVK